MNRTIKLDADGNAEIALQTIEAGSAGAVERIPRGHKIALTEIDKGKTVRKYAQPIGYASRHIAAGSHIHTHNLEFRQVSPAHEHSSESVTIGEIGASRTFPGYRRADGRVGTGNYIGVIASVNCSATAARMIASHFDRDRLVEFPNVDGVAAFVHGTGCGMADDGEGFEALQRVMRGYARNPILCGVLMVGLGCETNQIDWLIEAYGIESGLPFQTMNIQERAGPAGTVELGIRKIEAMLPAANDCVRVACPVSELTVALQCGGSDSWSGVTANPALGNAVDRLVGQGGTGALAETPEVYGAENLLVRRSASREVGEMPIDRIRWWEDCAARNHGSISNNPSPGNKAGGLSAILEKSLGRFRRAARPP